MQGLKITIFGMITVSLYVRIVNVFVVNVRPFVFRFQHSLSGIVKFFGPGRTPMGLTIKTACDKQILNIRTKTITKRSVSTIVYSHLRYLQF